MNTYSDFLRFKFISHELYSMGFQNISTFLKKILKYLVYFWINFLVIEKNVFESHIKNVLKNIPLISSED